MHNGYRLDISLIISGKICSGKSTIAKVISEKYGVPIASFGGYLRNYCQENEIEITRKNLQDIGENFIQKDAKMFLDEVISFSSKGSRSLIFEGVRHKTILNLIKGISKKSKMMYVFADKEIRYKRFIARAENDSVSIEEFDVNDNHIVESEIEQIKNECDLITDTSSSSIEEMAAKIEIITRDIFGDVTL